MPEEIVLNLDAVLAWCAVIAGLGAAGGYLLKAAKPLTSPFKKMQRELKELEDHSIHCDEKFANDQKQLSDLKEEVTSMKVDIKMMLEGQLLIMKHVETGNCTGEVADGRAKLERYLINR